jgi:hypothetical protein
LNCFDWNLQVPIIWVGLSWIGFHGNSPSHLKFFINNRLAKNVLNVKISTFKSFNSNRKLIFTNDFTYFADSFKLELCSLNTGPVRCSTPKQKTESRFGRTTSETFSDARSWRTNFPATTPPFRQTSRTRSRRRCPSSFKASSLSCRSRRSTRHKGQTTRTALIISLHLTAHTYFSINTN